MLGEMFRDMPGIAVKPFKGLLINFAAKENSSVIIRGLRAISDFDYELQLASNNSRLNKNIETLFLMASEENLFTSSSMIKEIAFFGGDITGRASPLC